MMMLVFKSLHRRSFVRTHGHTEEQRTVYVGFFERGEDVVWLVFVLSYVCERFIIPFVVSILCIVE